MSWPKVLLISLQDVVADNLPFQYFFSYIVSIKLHFCDFLFLEAIILGNVSLSEVVLLFIVQKPLLQP